MNLSALATRTEEVESSQNPFSLTCKLLKWSCFIVEKWILCTPLSIGKLLAGMDVRCQKVFEKDIWDGNTTSFVPCFLVFS